MPSSGMRARLGLQPSTPEHARARGDSFGNGEARNARFTTQGLQYSTRVSADGRGCRQSEFADVRRTGLGARGRG